MRILWIEVHFWGYFVRNAGKFDGFTLVTIKQGLGFVASVHWITMLKKKILQYFEKYSPWHGNKLTLNIHTCGWKGDFSSTIQYIYECK